MRGRLFIKKIIIACLSLFCILSLFSVGICAEELDDPVIDELLSDAVDWLLLTHIYADALTSSSADYYGTCNTLRDYIDETVKITLQYDLTSPYIHTNVTVYDFDYFKVTYHNWNGLEDMYSEARKIFCGEWVERSVHSIAGQKSGSYPVFYQTYEQFIERDGSLYVCCRSRGEDFMYLLSRQIGTRYELLGKESAIGYDEEEFEALKPYVNAHLYPYHGYVYKDAKVADKYLYKVAEANDTRALVEVIMFDELAVRNQAFKATLELSNTADGWRIAGGTLIEALYDGKILTKISEDEYLAFLADIGREEINPPRVSPDTEDASGSRVAFLAVTTVLAAIIPAGVLTVWRRRKSQA